MRAAEEELLARVRDALGAKHVIRVCSSYDQVRTEAVLSPRNVEALRRQLHKHAD